MTCPNGHPVDDKTRYCPECGIPIRCPQGHVLPAGAAFCPQCGFPTGPVHDMPAPPTPTAQTTAPVRRRRRWTRKRVALTALAGVVAWGIVLGTIGAIINGGKDDDPPDDTGVPVRTLYEICVDEVTPGIGYLMDNGYSSAAVNEVANEYGAASERFQTIINWAGELSLLQSQEGREAAEQRARELVSDYCDAAT